MTTSIWGLLIKGLLIPICGIFLVNKFNLFSYMSFIPQDYVYETGLATYFLVLEFLFTKIPEKFEEKFKTDIQCTFYSDEATKSLKNTPAIAFPPVDVVSFYCELCIKGSKRRLNNLLVVISFPQWVEAQASTGSLSMSIGTDNRCTIDLSKLLNPDYNNKNELTVRTKISLIRNSVDEKCSIEITPKLDYKKRLHSRFLMRFVHNSITLKN